MNLFEYLFLLLLSLPPSAGDRNEPAAEREARLRDVAHAIEQATIKHAAPDKQKDFAVLLVTTAWWESRLARNVHALQCKPYECDPYHLPQGGIVHRARGLWQLQRTPLVGNDWTRIQGADRESTKVSADLAAQILVRGQRACRTVAGAMSYYARGTCTWAPAEARARWWRKMRDKKLEDFEKELGPVSVK